MKLTLSVLLAAFMWFVMFSPWTAPFINFWLTMAVTDLVLISLATALCPEWLRDLRLNAGQVLIGVGLAAIMWCIFWTGDKVSQWMFDFARPEVDLIYGMKEGTSPYLIALLLGTVIGPSEEIFWRAFVQRRVSRRWGGTVGFVVTLALYSLIHVWSFNFMLVMAALVAGGCWGLVYRFKPQWLTGLIISHALWDACAFVLLPF